MFIYMLGNGTIFSIQKLWEVGIIVFFKSLSSKSPQRDTKWPERHTMTKNRRKVGPKRPEMTKQAQEMTRNCWKVPPRPAMRDLTSWYWGTLIQARVTDVLNIGWAHLWPTRSRVNSQNQKLEQMLSPSVQAFTHSPTLCTTQLLSLF